METGEAPKSLQERLAQQTQMKEPSNEDPIKQSESKGFWGDSNDSDPGSSDDKKTNIPAGGPEGDAKPAPGEGIKMPRPEAERYAASSTSIINSTTVLLGNLVLKRKLKKKFNEEEIQKIDLLEDVSKDLIKEDKDKQLIDRWTSAMNKYLKKQGKLRMNDNERKDLIDAWATWHQVTGKKASPEFALAMALLGYAGEKGIEIFMD